MVESLKYARQPDWSPLPRALRGTLIEIRRGLACLEHGELRAARAHLELAARTVRAAAAPARACNTRWSSTRPGG